MMKWLLVLFATYMLVLPCIPCNAAEVCCEEESICSEEKTSCKDGPEEGTGQHEHSAACPCCPSFSCNTCHSVVVAGLAFNETIIPARIFDIIPFTDKPLAHFSANIWQPPKVLC